MPAPTRLASTVTRRCSRTSPAPHRPSRSNVLTCLRRLGVHQHQGARRISSGSNGDGSTCRSDARRSQYPPSVELATSKPLDHDPRNRLRTSTLVPTGKIREIGLCGWGAGPCMVALSNHDDRAETPRICALGGPLRRPDSTGQGSESSQSRVNDLRQ
jgi:hypothetical protein